MNKILKDRVENAILIFPFWKAQSWFPLVLENVPSFPVRLPRHKDLLTLPYDGTIHPLHKSIQMIAVTIRKELCKNGLQDEISRIITVSWSQGTRKQYNSA